MHKLKNPIIILTAFLLSWPVIKGQEYVPFPSEDATWNVYLESTCDNDSPPDTFLLRYMISGDTTINETVYYRLVVEKGDTINPTLEPMGGIREEDRRVYYYGRGILGGDSEEELLLYDFNAQVEDTIYHSPDGIWKSIVLETDSIQIADQFRKRYKVDNGWFYHNPDYIVEGIGSVSNGLLGHISAIPTCGYHYWEHVCFRMGDQVLYLNPVFNDCYAGVNLSSSELLPIRNLRIYPNPFAGVIQIDNQFNDKSLTVRIYDSGGRLIIEKEIDVTDNSVMVQGSAGLYILILIDGDGRDVRKEKIVKL